VNNALSLYRSLIFIIFLFYFIFFQGILG